MESFYDSGYKYPAKGEGIVNLTTLVSHGVLYEIRCANKKCELCARTQGVNIQRLYLQFTGEGCPSCGKKDFVIKEVDI